MSASDGVPGTLIRARHQTALVAVFDAVWIAFTAFSLWFCSAVGAPFQKTGLLLFLVPHVVLAAWGILLLCAPNLFARLPIVLAGLLASVLSGILFLIAAIDVTACFPGCGPCLYWFTLLFFGYLAIAVAWAVLTFRYAAQSVEENTREAQERERLRDDDERGDFATESDVSRGFAGALQNSLRQRTQRQRFL